LQRCFDGGGASTKKGKKTIIIISVVELLLEIVVTGLLIIILLVMIMIDGRTEITYEERMPAETFVQENGWCALKKNRFEVEAWNEWIHPHSAELGQLLRAESVFLKPVTLRARTMWRKLTGGRCGQEMAIVV
jgi:hypothetical protein